jgi:phosphonate ABC transporter permease subunit PhnE
MTSDSGISTGKRQSELADNPGTDDRAPEESPPKHKRAPRRTLWLVIGILTVFVVYAYAFETTEVSLDKIRDERRQEQLFRVIRALARPELLTYEAEDTVADIPFMVPCPDEGTFDPGPVEGELDVTTDPGCTDPRTDITVSGTGFIPNTQVRVFFVPPSEVQLRIANTRSDSAGNFSEVVRIPNRPDDVVQIIRVESRQFIGSVFSPVMVETENGEIVRSPRWSDNAKQTLDGIIETVFLALLATTAGTIIAIPLSFLAAKNLMRDVRIPAIQMGLAITALPLGVLVGLVTFSGLSSLVEMMPESAWVHGAVTIAAVWVSLRLARRSVEGPDAGNSRLLRVAAAIGAGLGVLFAGQTLATFAQISGTWFAESFETLAFLGRFVATMGDIVSTAFGVLTALAGAGLFGLLGSKLGYTIASRSRQSLQSVLTVIAMAMAGAVTAIGLGLVVGWLYQIEDFRTTVVIPAIVGAVIGALAAWRGLVKGSLGAGIGVYYISRTISNTLRSIEPLVMALVFVIWVGLGPFAGSLALGLHTIASLTKLYSEQVESISTGPVEAVRATGATRLQTIVYGVVPQIVAPYISFTMYRWDINVRMSTIIGFVGGGGIGFLLQQNVGKLDYKAAAAQMLAIAIVVASMDFISSQLRQRYT